MVGNRAVVAICSTCLLLQWLTIGVGWTVTSPALQYGTFSAVIPKTTLTTHTLTPAYLSAQERTTYDSLVLVGDVLLARNVEVLTERNGAEYPLRFVDVSTFAPRPYLIGNFEASIPEKHVRTPTGQITFSVATKTLAVLEQAGFNAFSLANNHSLDYGNDGFANTVTTLEAENLSVFGHGRSLSPFSVMTVSIQDSVVALIGVNVLTPIREAELQATFSHANRISDFQVAYVHWGEEYALRQNDSQRHAAAQFVTLGADLVIGHHPHVTQGIEVIEGVPVLYSLGNFLFDQYFSQDVQEGLAVALTFDGGPRLTLEPYTSTYALSQPRPMSEDNRFTFLQDLAARSASELTPMILAGEITFGTAIATSSKMAIINE